jgi:hypothetical protein
MPIEPDTKNWTWVLDRPCPECGFDATAFDREDVAEMVRANVQAWLRVLDEPDASIRPSDDRWSTLEYACHVRDVFRIYDQRLARMLLEDDPRFANWDQDTTAVEDGYASQDPAVVAAELAVAGEAIAGGFGAIEGVQWARVGRRSDGANFTIESFARYFVHDPIHHLYDVETASWTA